MNEKIKTSECNKIEHRPVSRAHPQFVQQVDRKYCSAEFAGLVEGYLRLKSASRRVGIQGSPSIDQRVNQPDRFDDAFAAVGVSRAEDREMLDRQPQVSGLAGEAFAGEDHVLWLLVVQHILVRTVCHSEDVRRILRSRLAVVFVVELLSETRSRSVSYSIAQICVPYAPRILRWQLVRVHRDQNVADERIRLPLGQSLLDLLDYFVVGDFLERSEVLDVHFLRFGSVLLDAAVDDCPRLSGDTVHRTDLGEQMLYLAGQLQ